MRGNRGKSFACLLHVPSCQELAADVRGSAVAELEKGFWRSSKKSPKLDGHYVSWQVSLCRPFRVQQWHALETSDFAGGSVQSIAPVPASGWA